MTDKTAPLITIIIAVFNGIKTLQQCIDSVASQTYSNVELIVIDGGSKDGSVDLLNANQKKIRYWISEADSGIYNAWNKGLDKARGEWIYFLGADDFFLNADVLQGVIKQLMLLPDDVLVAYGQVMQLDKDGLPLYSFGEPWDVVKKSFKKKMAIPHQGVMHRRSLFERHGRFDESFLIMGDYELLLRELNTGKASFMQGIILAGVRSGGLSSSPEYTLTLLDEVRRAKILNGLNSNNGIRMIGLARFYIRSLIWKIFGDTLARRMLDFFRSMLGLPAYWTKI